MADFQTHITTSTVLGMAGGLAANAFYDVPAPSCMMAAALCSVAGMMPDLDAESDGPLRESVGFAAAIVPVMMLHRLFSFHFELETIVLISALIYLLIRFGFMAFLKNYTIHRGMFHSVPAALIFAELTFLIFDHNFVSFRLLYAGAVLVGYLSHLMLDEMWNVEMRYGMVHFKSTFGSALKFWGDNSWANFSAYGKLVFLTLLMTHDQGWTQTIEPWINGRYNLAGSSDKLRKPQLTDRERFMLSQYGGPASEEALRMANNPQYTNLSTNHSLQPLTTLATPLYQGTQNYSSTQRTETNDRAPYNPAMSYPSENPTYQHQQPSRNSGNYPYGNSNSLNSSFPLGGDSSAQPLTSPGSLTYQGATGNNSGSNPLYSPYSASSLTNEQINEFNPVSNNQYRSAKNYKYLKSQNGANE